MLVQRRGPRGLVGLLLLALVACGPDPPADPSRETAIGSTGSDARRSGDALEPCVAAATALAAHDLPGLVDLGPAQGTLRIELEETLVETDERTAVSLAGRAAFEEWLVRFPAHWRCDDSTACRWPGGLVTDGTWRTFGACCDLDPIGGMRAETLYLRRVCFAGAERGRTRLSLLAFAEAR